MRIVTLRDLAEYFSSLGYSLGEESTRQYQELQNLIRKIIELNFLDIALFHYFVFFMFLLTGINNLLNEIEIVEYIPPWAVVLYYILNISTFVFVIYFMWSLLKFGIGVIINMSM